MTTTTLPSSGRRRQRSRDDSENAKSLTFRLLPPLALLLGLALVVLGGRLLLAGIAGYQAQAFLDDWSSKNREPSPQAWQIAHDAAQRAISLHPGSSGEHLERLGHVLQWQHFRQPFGATEAQSSRRAALEAFRAASEARPTWPYNWTALAYAKLYLLEFDAEFAHALQQARALGPTRIDVNRALAEIGLLAWPRLDEQQRQATLEAARKTAGHSAAEARRLLAVAEHAGMSAELCRQLDQSRNARQDLRICP